MHFEWTSEFRLRVRALLHRRRLNRELEEEIQFHLTERAESYRRDGASPAEAARLSRLRFGNPTSWTEVCKDMWNFHWIEVLGQDLRYAVRSLTKAPGFTAVVVLTLALGIGAATSIFSVFDAAVLRALPYPDPDQLVLLWGNVQREEVERRGTSLADYADWRDESRSFESMALYRSTRLTFSGGDAPERLQGEYVAHRYFETLGVQPFLGRTFRPEEDSVPRRDAVAIISGNFWRRRHGGDRDIIGRSILLNGQSYAVVGVMPEWFRGLSDTADVWIPLHMIGPAEAFSNRGGRGPAVVARLKPGVTIERAQAEMDGICERLEQAYPETNEGRGVELSPLGREILGEVGQPLRVLLAAVGLVLLIACANVANLILVRSESRQREVAVRAALGAGRGRVYGQLAVECGLLTLLGAVGGVLAAHWGVRALIAGSPIAVPSYIHPAVDSRILLFVVALVCGLALLLSLAPAIQLRGVHLQDVFKQSSRGSTSDSSQAGFRKALIIAEVALAMLLLVGAGLLARSIDQLSRVNLGYETSGVLTLRVSLPSSETAPAEQPDSVPGEADAQTAVSVQQLVDRVTAIPAVEAAAAGSDTPLTGSGAVFYSAQGQTRLGAQTKPRAYIHGVTPDFFLTLGMQIKTGRTFTAGQAHGDSNVVVVSEKIARRFWPGENPIGKRIKIGSLESNRPWLTIVGVVGESNYRGIPRNPTDDPDLYLPFLDRMRSFSILVKTPLDPDSVAGAVRQVLREVNPNVVIASVDTLDRLAAQQTSPQRFTGWLLGLLAASALLLAMIGIYGVLSYSVERRVREIGIRLALGASRGMVLRSVTLDGLTLALWGLIVGAGCALALTGSLDRFLFGVQPTDPMTFVVAGLGLTIIAALASLLPAVKATRIEPAEALRGDT